MESLLPLILNMFGGAVGGNTVGALMKKLSLGTTGNSLAGIAGGVLAPLVLASLGFGKADDVGDLSIIIGKVITGGIGGVVLTMLIGFIKKAMGK